MKTIATIDRVFKLSDNEEGSKNLFQSFGTVQGNAVDSSDPNPQLYGDPLPAKPLYAHRGDPVIVRADF